MHIELGLITGFMLGGEFIPMENDNWITIIDVGIFRVIFSTEPI